MTCVNLKHPLKISGRFNRNVGKGYSRTRGCERYPCTSRRKCQRD